MQQTKNDLLTEGDDDAISFNDKRKESFGLVAGTIFKYPPPFQSNSQLGWEGASAPFTDIFFLV